jgi:hypothetical protein
VIGLIAGFALATSAPTPPTAVSVPQEARCAFFAALQTVEQGRVRSDHGKGLGPYCLHRGFWECAVKASPDLAGPGYAHCRSVLYSRLIIDAYLVHHAPKEWAAGNWEFCAMVVHRGPTGARLGRGREYARRVVNIMEADK